MRLQSMYTNFSVQGCLAIHKPVQPVGSEWVSISSLCEEFKLPEIFVLPPLSLLWSQPRLQKNQKKVNKISFINKYFNTVFSSRNVKSIHIEATAGSYSISVPTVHNRTPQHIEFAKITFRWSLKIQICQYTIIDFW